MIDILEAEGLSDFDNDSTSGAQAQHTQPAFTEFLNPKFTEYYSGPTYFHGHSLPGVYAQTSVQPRDVTNAPVRTGTSVVPTVTAKVMTPDPRKCTDDSAVPFVPSATAHLDRGISVESMGTLPSPYEPSPQVCRRIPAVPKVYSSLPRAVHIGLSRRKDGSFWVLEPSPFQIAECSLMSVEGSPRSFVEQSSDSAENGPHPVPPLKLGQLGVGRHGAIQHANLDEPSQAEKVPRLSPQTLRDAEDIECEREIPSTYEHPSLHGGNDTGKRRTEERTLRFNSEVVKQSAPIDMILDSPTSQSRDLRTPSSYRGPFVGTFQSSAALTSVSESEIHRIMLDFHARSTAQVHQNNPPEEFYLNDGSPTPSCSSRGSCTPVIPSPDSRIRPSSASPTPDQRTHESIHEAVKDCEAASRRQSRPDADQKFSDPDAQHRLETTVNPSDCKKSETHLGVAETLPDQSSPSGQTFSADYGAHKRVAERRLEDATSMTTEEWDGHASQFSQPQNSVPVTPSNSMSLARENPVPANTAARVEETTLVHAMVPAHGESRPRRASACPGQEVLPMRKLMTETKAAVRAAADAKRSDGRKGNTKKLEASKKGGDSSSRKTTETTKGGGEESFRNPRLIERIGSESAEERWLTGNDVSHTQVSMPAAGVSSERTPPGELVNFLASHLSFAMTETERNISADGTPYVKCSATGGPVFVGKPPSGESSKKLVIPYTGERRVTAQFGQQAALVAQGHHPPIPRLKIKAKQ